MVTRAVDAMQHVVFALFALALGFVGGLYWGGGKGDTVVASSPAGKPDAVSVEEDVVLRDIYPGSAAPDGSEDLPAVPSLASGQAGDPEEMIFDVDNYLPPPRPPAHLGEDLTHIPDP